VANENEKNITAGKPTGETTDGLGWPPRVSVRSKSAFAITSLSALQEWEGYVVAVEGDHFIADMVDLTAGRTRPDQQATIPLAELSESDLLKLAPGRIFRWAIGYQRNRAGTKSRVSQIIFRDLPRWTTADRRFAIEHASDIEKLLDKNNAEEPDSSAIR
jgi:hypothetical protein